MYYKFKPSVFSFFINWINSIFFSKSFLRKTSNCEQIKPMYDSIFYNLYKLPNFDKINFNSSSTQLYIHRVVPFFWDKLLFRSNLNIGNCLK